MRVWIYLAYARSGRNIAVRLMLGSSLILTACDLLARVTTECLIACPGGFGVPLGPPCGALEPAYVCGYVSLLPSSKT
jgi:hypothetical protein